MRWEFIKKRWRRLTFRLLVFTPLVVAVWWISSFEPEEARFLIPFEKINEIVYACNAITIAFTLASFAVVALSLLVYAAAMLNELWHSPKPSRPGKFYNIIAIVALAVIFGVLVLLVLVSIAAARDYFVREVVTLQRLLGWSWWFAMGTFGLFLIVDCCFLASQSIHKKQILKSKDEGWEVQAAKKQLSFNFSMLSIFLINLPMLAVMGLAGWLSRQLELNRAFRGYIDLTFGQPLMLPSVSEETYHLFTNGLDAGSVSAAIILSQLIFAGLQTRWDYEEFRLDNSGPTK